MSNKKHVKKKYLTVLAFWFIITKASNSKRKIRSIDGTVKENERKYEGYCRSGIII